MSKDIVNFYRPPPEKATRFAVKANVIRQKPTRQMPVKKDALPDRCLSDGIPAKQMPILSLLEEDITSNLPIFNKPLIFILDVHDLKFDYCYENKICKQDFLSML